MIFRYNLILISLSLLILFGAKSLYQDKEQRATLEESRFITTEWYLLQIIKHQAEEEIKIKNQEVRRLRAQYELIKEQKFNSASLHEIGQKIDSIEDEKRNIFDQMKYTLTIRKAEEPEFVESFPIPERLSSLSDYFHKEEQEEFKRRIQSDQNEINKLKNDIKLLQVQKDTLESLTDINLRDMQNKILERDKAMVEVYNSISELRQSIAEKSIPSDSFEGIEITSLYKFELVKVILGIPEIKAEYPDLREELQLYIERLNTIERTRAQQETYKQLLLSFDTHFNSELFKNSTE